MLRETGKDHSTIFEKNYKEDVLGRRECLCQRLSNKRAEHLSLDLTKWRLSITLMIGSGERW